MDNRKGSMVYQAFCVDCGLQCLTKTHKGFSDFCSNCMCWLIPPWMFELVNLSCNNSIRLQSTNMFEFYLQWMFVGIT